VGILGEQVPDTRDVVVAPGMLVQLDPRHDRRWIPSWTTTIAA